MTEPPAYYRPTKLDYLGDAAAYIDNEEKLGDVIALMSKHQIQAVFREFEDPYSSFNLDREYSDYYWRRFKNKAAQIKPDIILL